MSPVQWLPYADEIIVLSPGGRIAAHGDYDSLKLSCDYVRELQAAQKLTNPTNESSQEVALSVEGGSRLDSRGSDKVIARAVLTKQPVEAGAEVVEEPRPVGNFWYYVSSMGRGPVWMFAALVLFRVACNTAQRMSFHVFSLPCFPLVTGC